MIAVRGEQVVAGAQRLGAAYGDRFLADVQVQEPADLALSIQLGGLLLESTNQYHLTVEFEQLVLRQLFGH